MLLINGKWILMKMKAPLVIFTLVILSSQSFSQVDPVTVIQPLMACLTEAIPVERAKPEPDIEVIKLACSSEMQALSVLPASVRTTVEADVDGALIKHLSN